MACLPPQPLASPDAHTFEQSDRLVDVVVLPVQGAEYVVRAGARGSAVTVVILVRGHAGLEQVATDVVAEGTVGRFTLPRVLAGAQLVVQAKGKTGASVALDITLEALVKKKLLVLGGVLAAGAALIVVTTRKASAAVDPAPGPAPRPSPAPQQSGQVTPQAVTYPLHPAGRWGPVWGSRRPPGLPAETRGCSVGGAAADTIQRAAAQLQDPLFVATVLQLAQGESGQMFGRPANNYDNRRELPASVVPELPRDAASALGHEPTSALGLRARSELNGQGWSAAQIDAAARQVATYRPWGKGRISAWGVYNWNEGHGRNSDHLADLGIPGPGYSKTWQPHDDSPWIEVNGPVTFYAQIWRHVIGNRGTALDAARAVRGHHKKSGTGRQYLLRGRETGRWADAYNTEFDAGDRDVIDRHLRTAGVLTA